MILFAAAFALATAFGPFAGGIEMCGTGCEPPACGAGESGCPCAPVECSPVSEMPDGVTQAPIAAPQPTEAGFFAWQRSGDICDGLFASRLLSLDLPEPIPRGIGLYLLLRVLRI